MPGIVCLLATYKYLLRSFCGFGWLLGLNVRFQSNLFYPISMISKKEAKLKKKLVLKIRSPGEYMREEVLLLDP